MSDRKKVKIVGRDIGDDEPPFIIGEIGINHNGSLENAKRMIDMADFADADAVKFQKREPEVAVPEEEWHKKRETPWGTLDYIDYKKKIEFGDEEYKEIDEYCKEKDILWSASVWDEPSFDFIEDFDVPFHKVASPMLTDHSLLKKMRETSKPIILSTGMSNMDQIMEAVEVLGGTHDLVIQHCVSTYPADPEELNLKAIQTLREKFDCPIGYSGHETGLQTTYAAVALGACTVERHITLDRTMWGSDQVASVEPFGFLRLVRDCKVVHKALGEGEKKVHPNEVEPMKKLRKTDDTGEMESLIDLYVDE